MFSGRPGIFNRRRRPRQAVYASPQTPNPPTIQNDIPDEALADIAQDFENTARNQNHFPSTNRPSSHYQRARPSSQNRQFLTPQKHPNNQVCGNEKTLAKKPKFEQENFFKGNCEKSFGQQQNKCISKPGSYPPNTSNNFSSKFQNSTRSFSFVEKNAMNNPPPSPCEIKSEFSWNKTSYPSNSSVKTSTTLGNAKQPRFDERASFSGPKLNQNMNMKQENPTTKNDFSYSSGETGFSIQSVDNTMKLVTSTIQGVRQWSEYRDKIPLVFEIFVTLDSVPTSNSNGTAKLFNIKDNTGFNRCIYWEMDHKLPRMARGQLYRLIGALERKTGHFQCFAVRQAQIIEQRLAKQQVEICNDAMAKLVSMTSES